MNPHRFDALAKRLSRRAALAGGGSLAAALLGAVGSRRTTAAQDATPAVSPGAAPVATPGGAGPEILFVQTFAGGTWAPKPGASGVYLLTLTGHVPQTVYFADRPDRLVGSVPTREFLGRLGLTPQNPPNAAVVAATPDGEDVLVVELFNPIYVEAFGQPGGVTVTYEARVLADDRGEQLAALAARQGDASLPAAFGPVSLFIDNLAGCVTSQDCGYGQLCCNGACTTTTVQCCQDTDCGEGLSCCGNRCVAINDCCTTADCPSGQTCSGGTCIPGN